MNAGFSNVGRVPTAYLQKLKQKKLVELILRSAASPRHGLLEHLADTHISFGTFQGNSYYSHIILFGHMRTCSSHMSPSRGTCLAMCSMNVRCNTLCQTANIPQNGNLLDSNMIWTKFFVTSHKQNAYLPIRPCSLKTQDFISI
mgnify:CR=1 FL=1